MYLKLLILQNVQISSEKADHEIKYNLKLYATSANNSCRLDPKGQNGLGPKLTKMAPEGPVRYTKIEQHWYFTKLTNEDISQQLMIYLAIKINKYL